MQRCIKVCVFCVFVVGAMLSVTSVRAQDSEMEARRVYGEATEAFDRGDFNDALVSFRHAQKLKPSWKIYFNIGQCEAALKNYGRALEAFEQYISNGGDEIPPNRQKEVVGEIHNLSNKVGAIVVEAPTGAQVTVDGFDRGTAPISGRIRLAVGTDHEVRAQWGDSVQIKTVKVGFNEELTVSFSEEDVISNTSTDKSGKKDRLPSDATLSHSKSKRKMLGIVLLGVGGAALVAGGITGIAAISTSRTIDEECVNRDCEPDMHDEVEKQKSLALTTDILLPVGLVSATVGVLLLTVLKKKSADERFANKAVFNLTGNGMSMGWSF